ncbi:MAG TPA: 30S ribosomal protein S7 [bacterium]|nr:30S ribosomal protein S7 [bacterium]HPQ18533.1 30S ribosomal protein S7 [bacterium]
MPRKKILRNIKREVKPDSKYNDKVLSKFINIVMERGKKSRAQQIVYKAFDLVEKELKQNPLEVFNKAIENLKPELEVRPRRVGGATYQVPVEVPPDRKQMLAFRWLHSFAKQRSEKGFPTKLAKEIIAAYNNTGAGIKKREDVQKMAESNRAFAHYKW